MLRLISLIAGLAWLGSLAGAAPIQIRIATYNASLNRDAAGQLIADLTGTTNLQARRVAETLQRVRPDIVLINEFDFDEGGQAATLFHDNYLAVAQNGQEPLNYPHRYVAPSNTGIASGFDLDNNGFANTTIPAPGDSATVKDRYGNDCFGFGWFPGQYSFVVYSKYPIRADAIRTFRLFKWKDMPGAALPDNPLTPAPNDFYSNAELNVFRLSSKNHCDIPIEVASGQVLHLLASHPTPPSFDGAEDRNGKRNHDEIRLWADYIKGASYLVDDAGVAGGLGSEERFVILGDLNADPFDGDSYQNAINQLLEHPRVNASVIPSSEGGWQARLQGGNNATHQGDAHHDTADFGDGGTSPGNLRVDYVLPSKHGLKPVAGAVFWPISTDPTAPLINASDHRLVYLDVEVTAVVPKAVKELEATRDGNDVQLRWQAQPNLAYVVQKSVNATEWIDAPEIPIIIDPESNIATATVSGAVLDAPQFFRVGATLVGAQAAGMQALAAAKSAVQQRAVKKQGRGVASRRSNRR